MRHAGARLGVRLTVSVLLARKMGVVDTRTAEEGDRCAQAGETACTKDGKAQLTCDSSEKLVKIDDRQGPDGCEVGQSRSTDMTLHGGTVTGEAVQTLKGGQPAARKGDPHVCPVHGKGVITGGSGSVFIEGKVVARMSDTCKCALAGVSGAGAPPAIGPGGAPFIYPGGPSTAPPKVGSTDSRNRTSDQVLEEDGSHGPYWETEVSDSDGDGTWDEAHVEGGVSRASGELETPEWGEFQIRGRGGVEAVRGRAEANASSGESGLAEGAGVEVAIEGRGVHGEGEVEVRTPFGNAKWKEEGSLVYGNGEVGVLVGNDGTRSGVESRGGWGVGAGRAEGNFPGPFTPPGIPDLEVPIVPWWLQPLLPFEPRTIATDTDAEFSAKHGFGAELGLYRDSTDGRYHFKVAGGIENVGFNIEVSLGPSTKSTEDPGNDGGGSWGADGAVPSGGIPNKIAIGFPLVLIGD
ncbi:MAG: PAAR domain-containing protein [Polyangiaceae bacterium]|nr:PAAR domain-containing protein [Polyangiaceae bacterium]